MPSFKFQLPVGQEGTFQLPAPGAVAPAQPVFVFGQARISPPAEAAGRGLAVDGVFSVLRFYLGLSCLAATGRVCKAWQLLVEDELVWERLLALGTGLFANSPLWRVDSRHCHRAKDEVKFLWNLCNFPAPGEYPEPALPPPSRPAASDRISAGSSRMMESWPPTNDLEWHEIINCRPSPFSQAGARGRARLKNYFLDAPHHWTDPEADEGSSVMCLSSLVKVMNNLCNSPDATGCRIMLDAGLGPAMIAVLKLQTDTAWLATDQNSFCINYAISSLGSALHA